MYLGKNYNKGKHNEKRARMDIDLGKKEVLLEKNKVKWRFIISL